MLRSLRALWLFWRVFASYGLYWLGSKLLGPRPARLQRLHEKNALRLARGFMRLRGVFIKLGQVLSVLGSFLPAAFGRALEQLQDRVPPRPFREIMGRLSEAFGDDPLSHFERFEHTPIAAASLAQVHEAVSKDGERLAVKVLYPGIEKLIRRDLAVLRRVAPRVRKLLGLGHQFERSLEQLSAMLDHETNYANERGNMEKLRAVFKDRADVVVPEVIDELTAGGVITMRFEEGTKISDWPGSTGAASIRKTSGGCSSRRTSRCCSRRACSTPIHIREFLGARRRRAHARHPRSRRGRTRDRRARRGHAHGGHRRVDEAGRADPARPRAHGLRRGGRRPRVVGRVGRDYLKVLSKVKIDDFSRLDAETVRKLSGYEQTRGQLREVMKSVHYPDGFFYVERTLVLLFGLVGKLAPKAGLPGLVGPHAVKAFMSGFVPPPAAAQVEPPVPPAPVA